MPNWSQFWLNFEIFTWGVLTFVASILHIHCCILSYFEVTINLLCYPSSTVTT